VAGEFSAVKVTDAVWWVGAVDWGLRDFHGYATQRGTTYNAYLVMADKVTLIDTVKRPFLGEMMARISSVVEPRKIDYVVSNHTEMDHSGSLGEVIAAAGPEKVFASKMGVKALGRHFDLGREVRAVADGETLSLGNMNLTFVETRMLHWPDSMFTYLAEEELLFSSDAFGMHLASSERFDDEIDPSILEHEGARYFANILLPYSPLVTKLIARVGELGIPIRTICSDHGPVWRSDVAGVIQRYAKWAAQKRARKAVVVYDTMWQSTAAMARAVTEGLTASGVSAKLMPLKGSHRSDVAAEMLDAGALVVGSPTLNNGLFPTVADLLCYLKGLKPKGLVGAAFGSYGWSGEAVRDLAGMLEAMKIELVSDPVKSLYVPGDEELANCRSLGMRVGDILKERCPDG